MLVNFSAVYSFVFQQNTALVFDCAVCKVHINKTWDNNQQNEERTQQNWNLVLFLQQKARHSNRYIIVAGTVRVPVLQKVLASCFISQNLPCVNQTYKLTLYALVSRMNS